MDYYSSKISKTEWNTYSNWYFEASKHDQETKIASLQNVKIKWGKQLKKDKMPSKASCSFSLDFLSEVTPLSLFLLYCLYPQFLHINSLTKFHFFHEILPTPLSYELIRTCFFKIKCSEEGKWSKSVSHSVVSNSLWPLDWSLCPWNSPGKNTGVGYHSHLQRIFQTQGPNLGLPHGRQILDHLSHQGSLYSEDPEVKSFISYMPWAKAELWTIVKDIPKVTKDSHRFAEEFSIVIQTYQHGFSDYINYFMYLSRRARPNIGW